MTHSGGKPHLNVGDKGQRYEVRALNRETGDEETLGWTTEADGGCLMRMANLWPRVKEPRIIDREYLINQTESKNHE